MPIFSALLGAWFCGAKLKPRNWLGVAAAALGVALLLWYELTNLSGRPLGVVCALVAAAVWALGTQQLRKTTIAAATLTISFWMTVMTVVMLTVLGITFKLPQWKAPSPATWAAMVLMVVAITSVLAPSRDAAKA